MTAKLMEDHALADEVDSLGYVAIANAIRKAESHEAVDEWRAEIADLVEALDEPGLPSVRESRHVG